MAGFCQGSVRGRDPEPVGNGPFAFENPHLPIALQAVGGALAGAGWDILGIEGILFRGGSPAFHAQRKGVDFWIFVRTAMKGCWEAAPFEADEEQCEEAAAECNSRCLWITVTLESIGKNYAISAEGWGEFADELRPPLELRKPEEFQVVALGESESIEEPVLDEADAAMALADSINNADLREFSKLLVEDVEYVSDTTKVRILGRQQLLSYLGTKLHWWEERKISVTEKVSMARIDGELRPCTLAFDEKGNALGCTIFTGRKGHVAAVRNLSAGSVEIVPEDEAE